MRITTVATRRTLICALGCVLVLPGCSSSEGTTSAEAVETTLASGVVETTAAPPTEATTTTVSPIAPFIGFWNGDFGDLLIQQVGDEARIAYECCDVGGIRARVVDGALVGWYEDSTGAGRAEFRLLPDGTLDGRWHLGEDGTWNEAWDMAPVADREPAPELEAKLTDDAFYEGLRTD